MIRSLSVILALGLVLGACDSDPVDPGHETYGLVAVNGDPLPAAYPDPFMPPGVFEATAGTLTLRADGTLRLDLTMRCRSPLPAGTECEVSGDGRASIEGRYFRSDSPDGEVELGERRYASTFDPSAVLIDIAMPPSMGWSAPRFLLEFRRG